MSICTHDKVILTVIHYSLNHSECSVEDQVGLCVAKHDPHAEDKMQGVCWSRTLTRARFRVSHTSGQFRPNCGSSVCVSVFLWRLMPWLSDALQGARLRGRDLGQSVREHARGIASRTQQLEDVLVGTLQSNLSASEMEAKLEFDAKKLWRPAQAAEVLQRWLVQMRNSETRYLDIATAGSSIERLGPGGEPAQLTFHQVFLRSRALELTVDTVARASKLRSALREHALPPPELWPEERQFPAAFAQAFVALLEATIGPREQWFGTLHALLSSEKYADEQCHVWLVQLLSGLRQGLAVDCSGN